jgi:hypothetical protein
MEGFKVEKFNRRFAVVRSFLCEGDEEEEEEEKQMDTATFFEDRNTMSEFNISLAKTDTVYIDIETERCA